VYKEMELTSAKLAINNIRKRTMKYLKDREITPLVIYAENIFGFPENTLQLIFDYCEITQIRQYPSQAKWTAPSK